MSPVCMNNQTESMLLPSAHPLRERGRRGRRRGRGGEREGRMAVQQHPNGVLRSSRARLTPSPTFSTSSPSFIPLLLTQRAGLRVGLVRPNNAAAAYGLARSASRGRGRRAVRASGGAGSGSLESGWQSWWKPPERGLLVSGVSLSDVLWPSAGAFAAMAMLGRLDQMVASKGLSFTIAPLGAVCAVLFASPNSPAAKKYNMFVAQIGCAAFGVLALSIFGPGWLARGASLAASMAFMIATGTTHPPAASLPIMFIDGAKFHHLNYWYVLFPGAVGCILLSVIQEMVNYLKKNCKF